MHAASVYCVNLYSFVISLCNVYLAILNKYIFETRILADNQDLSMNTDCLFIALLIARVHWIENFLG